MTIIVIFQTYAIVPCWVSDKRVGSWVQVYPCLSRYGILRFLRPVVAIGSYWSLQKNSGPLGACVLTRDYF